MSVEVDVEAARAIEMGEFFGDCLGEVLQKKGKFPRALFQKEIGAMGIRQDEQVDFAAHIVSDPRNDFGRIMILHRDPAKNEEVSPATQIARGRGSSLKESYVVPHVEDESCEYESFQVISGEAVLVIWGEDGQPKEFIQVTDEPHKIMPNTIHSLLYRSPVVVAYEVKKVRPNAQKIDVPWAIKEGNPQVPAELERLHAMADEQLGANV